MWLSKQATPWISIPLAIGLAATGSAADIVFNAEQLPAISFPTNATENWRFFPVEWQTRQVAAQPADDLELSATLRIDACAVDEPPYDTGQYCRFASLSHFHYQAGFVLRRKPDHPGYYRVQFSVTDQSVAVWKAPDNFLAVAPCPIAAGRPIAVAIRLLGSRITVAVDGRQTIDVVDRVAPLTAGSVLAGVDRRHFFDRIARGRGRTDLAGRTHPASCIHAGPLCGICHDAASATAKLVTESLPDDFSDPRWVRIRDSVAADEMLPARTMERPDFSGHSSLSAAARRCSPGLAIPAIPTRMAPSRRSSRVCLSSEGATCTTRYRLTKSQPATRGARRGCRSSPSTAR